MSRIRAALLAASIVAPLAMLASPAAARTPAQQFQDYCDNGGYCLPDCKTKEACAARYRNRLRTEHDRRFEETERARYRAIWEASRKR